MAPKRGGGGSSSGSSLSSCPGAFATTLEQVYFASDVVFFTVLIGIAIALCSFRKKSVAGKKLLGIPYILTISFFLIQYACSIIATVLQECGTTDSYSYYNWRVAITVFYYLSYWFLLVVVVFSLNTMLRQQLGHSTAIFKVIFFAIIGIMGALTCVLIGLSSYVNWVLSQNYPSRHRSVYSLAPAVQQLQVAYYALYLVSLLVSGGLALKTIMSLRSRRHPTGDLIGWVIALFIAMIFWVVITIVFTAWNLQYMVPDRDTSAVLSWLVCFAQALSCIFVLCIAKHVSWNKAITTEPMAGTNVYAPVTHQSQYLHNTNPNGQQAYYYQQAPIYNGAADPVRA